MYNFYVYKYQKKRNGLVTGIFDFYYLSGNFIGDTDKIQVIKHKLLEATCRVPENGPSHGQEEAPRTDLTGCI